MLNLHPLTVLRGSPFSLLAGPQTSGFCYHCERVSTWEDLSFQYRCSHCGSDPVEEAEGAYGPVSLAGEFPTPAVPERREPPTPRRRARRFLRRRIPAALAWPPFGIRPSLTR